MCEKNKIVHLEDYRRSEQAAEKQEPVFGTMTDTSFPVGPFLDMSLQSFIHQIHLMGYELVTEHQVDAEGQAYLYRIQPRSIPGKTVTFQIEE